MKFKFKNEITFLKNIRYFEDVSATGASEDKMYATICVH